MFRVWMIWIRAGDGFTWLADAWEDDTTAENPEGWQAAVRKAEDDARANDGFMRIQSVLVPDVDKLFEIPTVTASAA